MHPVDAALQEARQLLGTLSTPQAKAANFGSLLPPPTNWAGAASEQAQTTNTELDVHREQLRAAHEAVAAQVNEANMIAEQGHIEMRAIETAWQSDKAALGPFTGTAAGQAALMQAGQLRLSEATHLVESTATQFQTVANQVRAAGVGLPHPLGGDPYEDWSGFRDGSEPEPVVPGAAPGLGVGPGIPAHLVSNSTENDWFEGDGPEYVAPDIWARPGDGAGPGIPADLVSNSTENDWFEGDGPEYVAPDIWARPGDGAGPGIPDELI